MEMEKAWQSKEMSEGKRMSCAIKDSATLSRLSPYPGTDINRYPLATKYHSWDIAFFAYEPVCYTKSRDEFDSENNLLVDEDILKLKQQLLRDKHLTVEVPSFKWNEKELDRTGFLIDRQSWHTSPPDDCELAQASTSSEFQTESVRQSRPLVKYRLEDNFLPLNPHGRTGIRGKGANRRWGPNHHFILAIVHSSVGVDGIKQTKLLFEMTPQNKLQLIEVQYALVFIHLN